MLVSSILGLTIARHFLDLPALADLYEGGRLGPVVEEWFAALA